MPSIKLEQIHIDVVRNATDDFNPFHDPQRWQNIEKNPFGGPIALGFQLVALALDKLSSYRREHGEEHIADENRLHFSNYQFTFASAVVTRLRADGPGAQNGRQYREERRVIQSRDGKAGR